MAWPLACAALQSDAATVSAVLASLPFAAQAAQKNYCSADVPPVVPAGGRRKK